MLVEREERVYMAAFLIAMMVSYAVFSGCGVRSHSVDEEPVEEHQAYSICLPEPAVAEFDCALGTLDGDAFEVLDIVEPMDMIVVELDGESPLEGIAVLRAQPDREGIVHLIACSLENPKSPRIIAAESFPAGYLDTAVIDAADLDRDGRDEVVLVPDIEVTDFTDTILVLNLINNRLVPAPEKLGLAVEAILGAQAGVPVLPRLASCLANGNLPAGFRDDWRDFGKLFAAREKTRWPFEAEIPVSQPMEREVESNLGSSLSGMPAAPMEQGNSWLKRARK